MRTFYARLALLPNNLFFKRYTHPAARLTNIRHHRHATMSNIEPEARVLCFSGFKGNQKEPSSFRGSPKKHKDLDAHHESPPPPTSKLPAAKLRRAISGGTQCGDPRTRRLENERDRCDMPCVWFFGSFSLVDILWTRIASQPPVMGHVGYVGLVGLPYKTRRWAHAIGSKYSCENRGGYCTVADPPNDLLWGQTCEADQACGESCPLQGCWRLPVLLSARSFSEVCFWKRMWFGPTSGACIPGHGAPTFNCGLNSNWKFTDS